MSGVKEERSISLLLRLDLEFLESTPKTLINSLHATARNFDTPSYWTLTLELQLQGFSECINRMHEGDDWRKYEGIISHAFYNAFIRLDNSSIRMGDFYECLIEPSNLKTYKKIIKGFDYLDIGAIHMKDSAGNAVASIGEKSDLIWEVFYGYFVNENEDGSIDHVYSNHEKYLSIQLFNVEALSKEEIVARVDEILLHVSMVYDMDFKVFEVDSLIKCEGEAPILRVEYTPTGFEEVPMFYLSNANNTNDERFKFLSYYQVIEYFFVRAQNYYFLEELKSIDMNNVNHNELRKILANYKKVTNAREALKLVLKRAIDIPKFKTWINSNSEHFDIYGRSHGYKIDLSKEDKKIISNIVERVYGYRCSIAHAKGDVEEYIAIPNISRKIIAAEIPLVKYLAYEVIKNCSEI
nr:hypothetical protein [Mediterraneibacter faecis]